MKTVTETISTVKSNPLWAIGGGVAGYFVAKKLIKTEKLWVVIASAVAGAVVVAVVHSKMAAKATVPTKETVIAPANVVKK